MKEDESKNTNIASRLRLARENAGLSQGQVAQLMNMHRPTVSEIEAGRRKVSAEEITQFSRIYDISTFWLMNTEEADEQKNKIELAARELAKLKPDDLNKVINLLSALRDEDQA